jgi:transposase-like protein
VLGLYKKNQLWLMCISSVLLMRRLELYATIRSTNDAILWCREKGLIARSCMCDVCGNEMKEEPDNNLDGRIWRCRRTLAGRRHQKSRSIRHGSLVEGRKMDIKDVVYLIYEWAVETPAFRAAYEMQLTPRHVRRFYAQLRGVCRSWVESMENGQVGGSGEIMEIDKCQLGRRKAHRGRVPREIWVFGGIVRGSNPYKCFIEIVQRRNERTLLEVIRRRIHPSSRIISDGWGAYTNLQAHGFVHQAVNHNENFVSPEDPSVHIQNIENLWGCLRRFLRSKGTYTRKDLCGYLDEFLFRRRSIDAFDSIISLIERASTQTIVQ